MNGERRDTPPYSPGRAAWPGGERHRMTTEELISRLVSIADDPGVAVHNRIRALEGHPPRQRDALPTADPIQEKIDELVKRRRLREAG